MLKRPYIPLGVTQQGRMTPTKLRPLTVDPELLLAQGSMSGPYRRTRPINRWTFLLRRFIRALLAPRPYL